MFRKSCVASISIGQRAGTETFRRIGIRTTPSQAFGSPQKTQKPSSRRWPNCSLRFTPPKKSERARDVVHENKRARAVAGFAAVCEMISLIGKEGKTDHDMAHVLTENELEIRAMCELFIENFDFRTN